MEKPALLRAEIEKHLPELAENPDKLAMFVTNGRVIATKGTLSHASEYTLSIVITDFTADIDILNAVIIGWLREYQADVVGPGYVDPKAYTFEVDILNGTSVDILIELKLTERARTVIDGAGNVSIDHPQNAGYQDLSNILRG